jgi:hypothetical protein
MAPIVSFLLSEDGVAELLHPLELVVHHLEDLGKAHQRLDAVVPGLLLQLFVERLILELRIGLGEPRGLDDLERVRGRHEDLRDQRIRIERDRRHDLLQLLGLEGRGPAAPGC